MKSAELKNQKRIEAEARNAAYQALPFEEKIKRNSAKVQAKLQKQKGETYESRNVGQ